MRKSKYSAYRGSPFHKDCDDDDMDIMNRPLDRTVRRSRIPNDYREPTPPPYSNEETRRRLRFMQADDWWQSQMPVSDAALAAIIGISASTFSEAINNVGGQSDWELLPRISRLIPSIESRRLCFPDTTPSGIKGKTTPKFLWLDPPARPFQIPRLSQESAWSLWAECQSCQRNQFLPVIMNGEPHVMCYYCLPPSQHRVLGAKQVQKSLIHEALKKYY